MEKYRTGEDPEKQGKKSENWRTRKRKEKDAEMKKNIEGKM